MHGGRRTAPLVPRAGATSTMNRVLLSEKSSTASSEIPDAIASDYARHATAARKIAEEFFDSDKVLRQFLQEVGIAP